jgi:hypothetical protein
VDQQGKEHRESRLHSYHEGQSEALANRKPAARFINANDMSKMRIEGGIKAILLADGFGGMKFGGMQAAPPAAPETGFEQQYEWLVNAEELGRWKELVQDSVINESVRRQQIHAKLAKADLASPPLLTRWLYKEVLHTDVDDPYLGLGGMLFAHYPFKEDGVRSH